MLLLAVLLVNFIREHQRTLIRASYPLIQLTLIRDSFSHPTHVNP